MIIRVLLFMVKALAYIVAAFVIFYVAAFMIALGSMSVLLVP